MDCTDSYHDTSASNKMENDDLIDNEVSTLSLVSSSHTDQLERCGRWLLSIPRDDLIALRQTQEYHQFLKAFERLGHVHRKDIARNRNDLASLEKVVSSSSDNNITNNVAVQQQQQHLHQQQQHHHHQQQNLADSSNNGSKRRQQFRLTIASNYSFLQHMAADDIVLRMLEFLECQSLIRISSTCFRFRELAHRSATQRTYDVATARQLNNVMMLLRSKEQIDGVGTGIRDSHVRVPILLLSRRVLVTDAGDPEYNGVYFCTGSNGNGFVFTKPRNPEQRVARRQSITTDETNNSFRHHQSQLTAETIVTHDHNDDDNIMLDERLPPSADADRLETEVAQPGQLLRCIIAKRFSNETILWYISKEVIALEDTGIARAGEVTQVFAFWAKLMVIGDASPDICRYPSQSSILSRHQAEWQALSTTSATNPPTIELLD